MKYIYIFLIVAACILGQGCHRQEVEPPIGENPEALSPEEVSILDSMPEFDMHDLSQIVLPIGANAKEYLEENDPEFYTKWVGRTTKTQGLSFTEQKNLLISKIAAIGLNLTDRNKFQYADEGVNKPAQNGLAYSFGQKDYAKRLKVPAGYCTEELYGLDCSGFVYQLFLQSGVKIPWGPAELQRKPETLNAALKAAFPDWQANAKDLGLAYPTNKFETGDIIYWLNKKGVTSHIGIILKDTLGNLAVFQSNGSTGDKGAEDCKQNFGNTRGCRLLQLADAYWFGSKAKYGIVRIEEKNYECFTNVNYMAGISSLAIDALGNKWYLAMNSNNTSEVVKFDGKNYTVYNLNNSNLPSDIIFDIVADRVDNIWICTGEGLAKWNGQSWVKYNANDWNNGTSSCTHVAFDSGNNPWVCTSNGVVKYNGSTWERVWLSLTNNYLSASDIVIDNAGIIWVESDGILRYDGVTWTHTPSGNLQIMDMTADNQGVLWLSTSGNGIVKYDGLNFSYIDATNSPIKSNDIRTIAIDNKGNKWISTGYNLGQPDFFKLGANGQWTAYPEIMGVQAIQVDERGNKWSLGAFLCVLYQK